MQSCVWDNRCNEIIEDADITSQDKFNVDTFVIHCMGVQRCLQDGHWCQLFVFGTWIMDYTLCSKCFVICNALHDSIDRDMFSKFANFEFVV